MSNFMLEALLGTGLPGVTISEGRGSVGEIPLAPHYWQQCQRRQGHGLDRNYVILIILHKSSTYTIVRCKENIW